MAYRRPTRLGRSEFRRQFWHDGTEPGTTDFIEYDDRQRLAAELLDTLRMAPVRRTLRRRVLIYSE